ncbi:MAG TPA: hypothetical protein VJC12_02815 [Candidatus Paceibacterota bacterium]
MSATASPPEVCVDPEKRLVEFQPLFPLCCKLYMDTLVNSERYQRECPDTMCHFCEASSMLRDLVRALPKGVIISLGSTRPWYVSVEVEKGMDIEEIAASLRQIRANYPSRNGNGNGHGA